MLAGLLTLLPDRGPPGPLIFFRAARWVTSEATFLARLMSARDARGQEDEEHERAWRPAVRRETLGRPPC
jgi:hypothetical protein